MTSNRLPRLAVIIGSAALLGACSWASNLISSDKVDYKSTSQSASVPSLEIPPDLTAPARDGRFTVPGDEARRGAVTASELAARGPAQKPQSSGILPRVPDARIERAGNQRWLVVKTPPAELWPQIKEFWQEMGFVLDIERPESGVMETDWAENRAKIGQDFIRRTVGRFLDGLYSTPERDKFRTRLEVNNSGETEIYVSHRGMVEIYRTEGRDQTAWQPRLPDPELEVDFLTRLMVRLGSEQTVARRAVETAGASRPVERAKIVKSGAVAMVEIDEGFDRAWRRVGLALDRVGFTVEDRDRSRGVYFVRYADTDATKRRAEPGMLSRFTNWFNQDRVVVAEQYKVKVSDASAVTRVAILSKTGVPEDSQTTQRILNLLHEQLK